MAPKDFRTLSDRRRERAQALDERYPASRQALEFCASLASFQERIFARTEERAALPLLLPAVLEWIGESGTQRMREAALELDQAAFRKALDDYWERRDTSSLPSFFARAVLQPYAWAADLSTSTQSQLRNPEPQPEICPRCNHLPQAGVLRPQGHGRALSLLCSLCLHEWPFGRGRCPACGEEPKRDRSYYSTEDLPHIQLQACESCRSYLHLIDLSKEESAVPEVDELAALPLDVWAREKGYLKLQLNLAGI